MYEYMTGVVKQVHPTAIVLEVNHIGYRLLMANPFRLQEQLGTEVTVQVELIVREDAHTLYGFMNSEEKQLFHQLISVSGIGPKSAVSILAAEDQEGFVTAIESGDVTYLTKFPGVGKKTAQQIILDLKGKVDFSVEETKTQVSTTPVLEEMQEALLGLGYSAKEIKKIMPELTTMQPQTTQLALKEAFKLLMKK